MKALLALSVLIVTPLFLKAQTNTFPSSGNVGIGTTSPDTKLHVSSSTLGDAVLKVEADTDNSNEGDNSRIELYQDGGALGAYIGFNHDWPSNWNSGNLFRIGIRYDNNDKTDAFVIKTLNGNIGINNSNPVSSLEVNGDISIARSHKFKFLETVNGADRAYIRSTNGQGGEDYNSLVFAVGGGNEQMIVNSLGNVGIGTTDPSHKLHVSSETIGDSVLKVESDTDNNNEADNSRIEILQDGGATGAYIGFNLDWGGSAGVAGAEPDNLFRIGTRYSNSDNYNRLVINTNNGNIGIGTTTPSEKLEVNGTIRTQEVKVESTPWPDYVFSETYQLNPLSEVSTYIKQNHHLPGIPTAEEVSENGIKLGEMNAKLLEKVEELTLYIIDLEERMRKLEKRSEP